MGFETFCKLTGHNRNTIMMESLWDLKQIASGLDNEIFDHDGIPMGFETLWIVRFVVYSVHIMMESLWDLKLPPFSPYFKRYFNHDGIPMGFETDTHCHLHGNLESS